MKRCYNLAITFILLIPFMVLADFKINGETKVKRDNIVRLSVEGAPEGSAIVWDFDESVVDAEELGNRLLFSAPPSTYKIKVRAFVLGKDGKLTSLVARTSVTVYDPTPTPTPPNPGPNPPTPDPDVVPIPGNGLQVLLIYETSELPKMNAEQKNILFAKNIREYLQNKCIKGPDGTPNRRFYDKDVDVSNEDKIWQNAMKRPRKSLPWIIISNGKSGFEGPLPSTVDDTLKLLKKYGGE